MASTTCFRTKLLTVAFFFALPFNLAFALEVHSIGFPQEITQEQMDQILSTVLPVNIGQRGRMVLYFSSSNGGEPERSAVVRDAVMQYTDDLLTVTRGDGAVFTRGSTGRFVYSDLNIPRASDSSGARLYFVVPRTYDDMQMRLYLRLPFDKERGRARFEPTEAIVYMIGESVAGLPAVTDNLEAEEQPSQIASELSEFFKADSTPPSRRCNIQ